MYVRQPNNASEREMPGRLETISRMPTPEIIRSTLEITRDLRCGISLNRRLQEMPVATSSWRPQNPYLLFTLVYMYTILLRNPAADAGLRGNPLRSLPRDGGAK